jgi:hypothetical protein
MEFVPQSSLKTSIKRQSITPEETSRETGLKQQ